MTRGLVCESVAAAACPPWKPGKQRRGRRNRQGRCGVTREEAGALSVVRVDKAHFSSELVLI